MTLPTLLVLRTLLINPGREMYGREIMQASLVGSSAYSILGRLEAAGWVSARDEKISLRAGGRPVRRYYQLTPKGVEEARATMARAAAQLAALGVTEAPPQAGPLNIGGIEIGVTVDERQPPGVVGIVSRGRESTSVSAFSLGASEPEAAGKGPCEHRIPPGAYCRTCERLI
jgi:PadR family transcriptional regulator PadR